MSDVWADHQNEDRAAMLASREKSMLATIDHQHEEIVRLRALLAAIAVIAKEPTRAP